MRLMVLLALVGLARPAMANPFGPTLPSEPTPGAFLDPLVAATARLQGTFYDGLTSALRAVADQPAALATLLALSFLYGVLHAAGPGHGKVVISSYMLASRETVRRGVLLAVAAAMLQATVAVALIGVLAGLFGLSRTVLVDATLTLERFAYALIVGLGLYLVFKAMRSLFDLLRQPSVRPASVGAAAVSAPTAHQSREPHDHAQDDHCGCGHDHMPGPERVERARNWSQTAALILGAGMRPCTGALLVLVLALSQGLFWQGALAAYAMGAGTALTVGVLAAMASGLAWLLARGNAGSPSTLRRFVTPALALVGGLLVLGFGALLLAASLSR